MAAVMLLSCHGQGYDDPVDGPDVPVSGEISISADKTLIQSDGTDYAQFTVMVGETDVTSEAMFFDAKGNILDMAEGRFSVSKPGEYQVWANYGTQNSDIISVRAIDIAIPETPADPSPSSTDFKSRVMLFQFTGTGCGNCPKMMTVLHPVLKDEEWADDVVWVALHTYNATDPAYVMGNAVTWFEENLLAIHPSLNFDMKTPMYYYSNTVSDDIRNHITKSLGTKPGKPAGIAVNSSVSGNTIIAKVTLKASEKREYRLGAMLLQDGIYARQQSATEEWMNTHDACVRYIDASVTPVGHKLNVVDAGKTLDYVFVWDLDQIWSKMQSYWDDEYDLNDLRLAVYVTAADSDGAYSVNNVVSCPVEGQLQYDYSK